ncbi:hypothetical protein HanRHA438_Chr11g0517731 [Helianthus annuus]|nr:hypothetical protein HanIR_Chr11g0543731 [Helianthus annuus]KAJ0871898.1 hypothetical protein HanRHA438_Chr11g0517731 [Helianthus annuus]
MCYNFCNFLIHLLLVKPQESTIIVHVGVNGCESVVLEGPCGSNTRWIVLCEFIDCDFSV